MAGKFKISDLNYPCQQFQAYIAYKRLKMKVQLFKLVYLITLLLFSLAVPIFATLQAQREQKIVEMIEYSGINPETRPIHTVDYVIKKSKLREAWNRIVPEELRIISEVTDTTLTFGSLPVAYGETLTAEKILRPYYEKEKRCPDQLKGAAEFWKNIW